MSATIEQPDRLAQHEEQMRQAEELLGSLPQKSGVAKGLFEGRFVADWVFPYPQLPEAQRDRGGTGGRESSNASATNISIPSASIARPTSRAK